MDGRNSRTTGVFSNDAYKSPEIGTAFSMTGEDNNKQLVPETTGDYTKVSP